MVLKQLIIDISQLWSFFEPIVLEEGLEGRKGGWVEEGNTEKSSGRTIVFNQPSTFSHLHMTYGIKLDA